jgi:transcriptional regulator GlxA family with amidase domain
VERIAAAAGFGSATAFRERFKRVTGTTPHAYRATFRSSRLPMLERQATLETQPPER